MVGVDVEVEVDGERNREKHGMWRVGRGLEADDLCRAGRGFVGVVATYRVGFSFFFFWVWWRRSVAMCELSG